MVNVKAMIPMDTEYYFLDDSPYSTVKDYYTTIKIDEEDLKYERYLKTMARDNLIKQIAKNELGNIRVWKRISLDTIDIKIVK